MKEAAIICRTERLPAKELLDDLFMMDTDKGTYYMLADTARTIWDLIAEPITLKKLVRLLQQRYQVKRNRCCRETVRFIEQLVANGLATVTDP